MKNRILISLFLIFLGCSSTSKSEKNHKIQSGLLTTTTEKEIINTSEVESEQTNKANQDDIIDVQEASLQMDNIYVGDYYGEAPIQKREKLEERNKIMIKKKIEETLKQQQEDHKTK